MNVFEAVKVWLWFSKTQKKAKEEVIMEGQTKPGWKTTEFWLTVATQIPMIVGIFIGASNPITLGLSAAATVAYTLGRAWSKANAAQVALTALAAAAAEAKRLEAARPDSATPPPSGPANS